MASWGNDFQREENGRCLKSSSTSTETATQLPFIASNSDYFRLMIYSLDIIWLEQHLVWVIFFPNPFAPFSSYGKCQIIVSELTFHRASGLYPLKLSNDFRCVYAYMHINIYTCHIKSCTITLYVYIFIHIYNQIFS